MTEAPPGVVFDTLFIAPFASHRWVSARSRWHWVELEAWQDSVAGNLFSPLPAR